MENERRIPDDEQRVRAEERLAGTEAGRIGGEGSGDELDPAERAPREAGGGEAEGFEQAEEQLIENAGHGEGNPMPDAFTAELESDRAGADYGEADELDSTEVTRDPEAEAEDPGEGPG